MIAFSSRTPAAMLLPFLTRDRILELLVLSHRNGIYNIKLNLDQFVAQVAFSLFRSNS